MSYIGNEPTSVAFLTDTFSGNGSTTAFTLSAAPATTSSILVAITGVLQDPSTYSVSGTTLTFSPAPPTGTGNISVRFLGIPASGVTTTAYRTVTEFTATSGQTTFSVPSYTPGFIDVYQNGVMLGSADYTASNGLSVVLAIGATVGDLVEVISFQVSSVLNAISAAPGSVGTSNLANSSVTMAKLDSTAQYTGFKNRIINGDMQIDQRNNGAAVTFASLAELYTVDRWQGRNQTDGAFSMQQVADAPSGFTNSLRLTVTTADTSLAAGQYCQIRQLIEGFNFADLGWGTSAAQAVTLSFWVKASITGAFNIALTNSSNARGYTSQYNISSANTWEYKTVTIPGDTSGTWVTNNGIGVRVAFTLGAGSTFIGTPNTWIGEVMGSSGIGNVMATNGATFQITGCQFEKGSTATSFDVLPYGTELMLCERYCQRGSNNMIMSMVTSTLGLIEWAQCVQFRTTPTATGATAPYVENVPWNAVGSATGVTFNMGHMTPRGGDIGVFGTYTPTPAYGNTWLIDATSLILSAEL